MTDTWWERFTQKDDRSSRSYDFIEVRPVWYTLGFRIGLAAACFGILWVFLLVW